VKKTWIILLSLLLVSSIFLAGCTEKSGTTNTSTTTTSEPTQNENVIKVGVLTDLSGPLSSDGTDIANTLKVAQKDINNYFKEKGIPYSIKVYIEDTQSNPSICLQKVQSFNAMGINLIIGPTSSAEVKNIKDYINSNGMIIISPSSKFNSSSSNAWIHKSRTEKIRI